MCRVSTTVMINKSNTPGTTITAGVSSTMGANSATAYPLHRSANQRAECVLLQSPETA